MSKTFAQYLDEYVARADYDETAAAALTQDEVQILVYKQLFARHEAPVMYELLGTTADDSTPVYRLGGLILLADVQTHLDALVTAGDIRRLNFNNFYVGNPSLRNGG